MTAYLDDPFRIDGRGRAGTTDRDDHVRDMIRQVLFTRPGERVNRPDFGCGLLQLVFQPAGEALATATEFLIRTALQRWLADVVQVETVRIEAREGELQIEVAYVRLDTGETVTDLLVTPVAVP